MTDSEIIRDSARACPCGESGRPREMIDPGYLAEVEPLLGMAVPDGHPSLCWDCRRLAAYSDGPNGEFARRCAAVLSAQ